MGLLELGAKENLCKTMKQVLKEFHFSGNGFDTPSLL